MTAEEVFQSVAEDAYNLEFYPDYSGRFMYGTKTMGVVGNFQYIFVFLQELGAALAENNLPPFLDLRMDDMGLQKILYIHKV